MFVAATHAELWNYSNDIYRAQTIERLDIAGLGPGAPVPPGITRLPAAGQYYASPALAALIRTVPADQLGDRFPGKLAGTIGQRALTGPDELVVYVGYQPAELASLPATTLVSHLSAGPVKLVWTHYFRDAFIVGAIAFLFPILILVGTATRLAAQRREERYAALRLVGATSRQISVISSVDAVVSALLGALVGIGIFLLLQPALAGTAITSARYFPDQVTPTAAGYILVLIGVPAAIAALISLRRVRISPLGVSRRVTPPAPTIARIAPLAIGIVLFALGMAHTNTHRIGQAVFPGLILILIGLVVGGPWLTAEAACSGGMGGPFGSQGNETALQQRISLEGLPPQSAAALLSGLDAFRGATAVPIYSLPGDGNPASFGPGGLGGEFGAVISCAGLREIGALGQCAPGRAAVEVQADSLFGDNPQYSTQPIASSASPAASDDSSKLYRRPCWSRSTAPRRWSRSAPIW